MGMLDFFRRPDLQEGIAQCAKTPNAVLVDVRTDEEYRQGHLPGSIHVPLQAIERIEALVPKKETPLFVYCLSGGRSEQATVFLRRLGYQKVQNIGGIQGYRGKIER